MKIGRKIDICAGNAASIMEGGGPMNELTAFNPKQLDICLKLLYAEGIDFRVVVYETETKKIAYLVKVSADAQTVEQLREKYRILIS